MKTRLLSGGRRWRLAGLISNALVQAGAALAGALCVQVLIDNLLLARPPQITATIWMMVGGFALAHAVLSGLKVLERMDAERMGFDYTAEVRLELFDRMTQLSPRAFGARNEGVMLVRFVGDLTALKQWVSNGLVRLCVAMVLMVSLLAACAWISPPLALTLGGVLALGACGALVMSNPLRGAVRRQRRHKALLSGFVAERVLAMSTLRSSGGASRERKRVEQRSLNARGASIERAGAAGGMAAVIDLTLACATVATVVVGAMQVAEGRMTPGAVVAATTVVGLLITGLRPLGRVLELWHAAVASREKIDDVLGGADAPRIDAPTGKLNRAGRGLVFENVTVPGVLQAFSASAQAGRVIHVRGPNGVGKSTLLQLAARLIEPAGGRILLGGDDLSGIRLEDCRRAIGLVSADAPLLRGSLRFNLRYRCPDAPQEEVDRVAALCRVDEIIRRLPDGEKARIAERGRNLSLGDRHRLMLARALMGQPHVLLLDEADANLDERTVAAVGEVLKTYPGVVLMVTRNPGWAQLAGETWRLRRDGSVLVRTRKSAARTARPSPSKTAASAPDPAAPKTAEGRAARKERRVA
jgi:ABC-type multidrug transport system fused ATPase/permease subunit